MALSSSALNSASYVTMTTWVECPSSSMLPVTETSTIDITTCPKCTMTSTMGPGGPTHTTVFVTSYDYICSTGWTNTPVTVTETCTGSTPSWPMSSSGYVPAGYTTTTTVCTVCNESKSPATVTVTVPYTNTPTGAPAAASSAPADPPVSIRSDGQPIATALGTAAPSPAETGTPVSIRSDGQPIATSLASAAPSRASGASAASGPASSLVTSAAPAPAQGGVGGGDVIDTTTTISCPGPQCMKTSVSSVPSGSIGGASSTPEPFTGGAMAVGVRDWQIKLLSGVAGLVAAAAFLL